MKVSGRCKCVAIFNEKEEMLYGIKMFPVYCTEQDLHCSSLQHVYCSSLISRTLHTASDLQLHTSQFVICSTAAVSKLGQ